MMFGKLNYLYVIAWLISFWLGGIVMASPILAQRTSNMLKKRSIPSRDMWRHLDRMSEFSEAEMRIIDRRSVFGSSEEAMISKRSDFAVAEERLLATRSEYSAQMMAMLEKRVEPEATQMNHVQRRSRAESRWLRVDRVADPRLVALFLRRSMMSQTELKQVERASDKTDLLRVIQRASAFAGSQSKILSGRSRASAAYLRLIQSRSSD